MKRDEEKSTEELLDELKELRKEVQSLREGPVHGSNSAYLEKDFFDGLIRSLPGTFYLIDEEGRFHKWNRNLEEITGYTPGEISGLTPLDFIDEGDREVIRDKIREAFAYGSASIETDLVCKDGSKVPFYFSGVSLRMGGNAYIIGIGIDISMRKRAEEELRKAHNELENRVRKRTGELREANEALRSEVRERVKAEEALRSVLEGTSSVAGEEFMLSLVKHLAQALGFRYTFVGEFVDTEKKEEVRTIAVWAGDEIAENFEYSLEGTPCENVMGGRTLCLYPSGVQELFPKDTLLVEMCVESYIGTPLFEASGRPVGILAALDDKPMPEEGYIKEIISTFASRAALEIERKRLFDANMDQSKKLEAFFKHTITPLVFLDRDFNFLMVSDSYARACRKDVADFRGRNHFEFYPHEENENIFREVVRTKSPYVAIAKPFVFPDRPEWGVTYWDWTLVPILDEEGEVDFLVFSLIDVTDQQKAIEALRASEEKYRTLFEEFKDLLYITTPEGRMLDINPAGVELLGYSSKEDVLKVRAQDLYNDPADREKFRKKIDRDGYIRDFETVIKRKDGERMPILLTASAMRDDKGRIVAYRGIAHDLTEYKNLERQLIQAQKMEAIGQLTGGIAHDFNNLMTIISSFSNLAMKDSLTDQQRSYLEQIRAASARASNLTRQLLIFSRKQPVEFGALDLNETVKGILDILRRFVSENISISIDCNPDLSIVRADKGNIEQLIMNLVMNARDALQDGGCVTVKTDNVALGTGCEGPPPPGAASGDYVLLTVEDNGFGMDSEVLSNIFEPFYSTKAVGHGIGLGLAVVQSIVKEHRGLIEVESSPGKGSTFKVYIPAAPEGDHILARKEETLLRSRKTGEGPWGTGERILVVEDEMWLRKSVSLVLSKSGYKVFEASGVGEAMDVFDSEGGDFDLVFTDMVLHDKTGIELIEALMERKPGMKALFSSGYMDIEKQWPVLCQRGFNFIQKPYEPPDLLRAIEAALNEE